MLVLAKSCQIGFEDTLSLAFAWGRKNIHEIGMARGSSSEARTIKATITSAAMPNVLPRFAVGLLSPIMAANVAVPRMPTETQIVVPKSGWSACGDVTR